MSAWKRFMGESAAIPATASPGSTSYRRAEAPPAATVGSPSPRVFFGTSTSTGVKYEWAEGLKQSAELMDSADFFASAGAASAHEDLEGTGIRLHYASGLPRPKFVKHYVLGPKLGEGAYAKVKEGMDSRTLRIVAVKIIDRRFMRKVSGGMEKLKREIAVMKALGRHPNVIELIEVIDDPALSKIYLVLELANGCHLGELIEMAPGKRLAPSQARYCIRRILIGLSYIHGKNVVHRDIKPANIMLTTDGEVKISDFGVAEFLDKYNPEDEVKRSSGTPAFQAPEIAAGEVAYSGMKTDVWSAGVTLFNCLTGTMPFSSESLMGLFDSIARGEFEMPEWLDEGAKDLLRGMLRVEWTSRLSVREALNHPWLKEGKNCDYSEFVPIPMHEPQVLKMVSLMFDDEDLSENQASSAAPTASVSLSKASSGKGCPLM